MKRKVIPVFSVLSAAMILVAACNLVRPGAATPGAAATSQPATLLPVAVPSLTGFQVAFISPSADSQLPGNGPVQVSFAASGGPFLEIDLYVDNQRVAQTIPTSSDPRLTGTMQWDKPAAGGHVLKLIAFDANKETATAEIQVQVGSGQAAATGAPSGSLPTAPPGGMQVRFVNLSDGGTIAAALDPQGKPVVDVKVEISGPASPEFLVSMTANGLLVPGTATYKGSTLPHTVDLTWSPENGGGKYTLVVTATNDSKQTFQASASVTVTGMAAFTATPPALSESAARQRFTQLYRQLYGVDIPDPSMQRFDFPELPNRSRWISAVYYQGQRYYIELFDDTHYELSPLPYADAQQRSPKDVFTICRPAGRYKILVVFVDYGNLGLDRNTVLGLVPVYTGWTNQLYTKFAKSQGFASSPLSIEAQAAWISPPPAPGRLLTNAQIKGASGLDPAGYDFTMEIDLDRNNSAGKTVFPGLLDQGGGTALQGCGPKTKNDVNIWSVVMTADSLGGNLGMDFDHELSHLFGMMDSWPFSPGGLVRPDGSIGDEWIPYVMFGWTDTDGDGIPEIIDPTPYGTGGPQP